MKRFFLSAVFASTSILGFADPLPEPPPKITTLTSTSFNLDWDGTLGNTYFIEYSSDLVTWQFMPDIKSGIGGPLGYGFNSLGDRLFLRLRFTDVATSNALTDDFDNDGISNWDEVRLGGTGTNPFSDDTDVDGLKDKWEIDNGLNPNDNGSTLIANGPSGDPDRDGLINSEEQTYGTDPNNPDSDGDGVTDGGEVDDDTDPNDPNDTPEGEWFILTGDLEEDKEKKRSRIITIPAGETRLIVIVLASDEYSNYTSEQSEYNDILAWNIIPQGQSAITGNINVNSRHYQWETAESEGTIIKEFSPAIIEETTSITAPPDADATVEIELSSTNIGDGILPSTVIVGVLPVEVRDVNGEGEVDDITITPWDTTEDIANNNIAWIDAHTTAMNVTPRMPQLEFRVTGLPEKLTIEAKFNVQYTRGNGARATRNQNEDRVRISANGNFTEVNGDTWQLYNEADWQTELAERGFFGGEATLTYQIKNGLNVVVGPEEIDFRIGGENPDDARCKTYIEGRPNAGPGGNLWFAYAISKSESRDYNGAGSRYNQFLELPNHSRDVGRPLWGNDGGTLPGGYGMFQITGTVADSTVNIPRREVWNWQDNVNAGLTILASKRATADAWITRQKNATNANGTVIPNHIVRIVTFAEGTNRTMNNAVTIKLFNGASRPPVGFVDGGNVPGFLLDPQGSGHYCFWRNTSGQWALNRFNNPPAPIQPFNYVDRVCSEIEN